MATTINQARTSISKMFNGEPRSYTRFNLAQNTDAENSQVELKLSSDVEEEAGNPEHSPNTYTQTPLRTYKNICYLALGTLVIFILGYLIGYVSPHKPDGGAQACQPAPTGQANPTVAAQVDEDEESVPDVPLPTLNWNDITNLLEQKLSPEAFSIKFSEFSLPRNEIHETGSAGDTKLAEKVVNVFKGFNMNVWNNKHSVKLPRPSSANPNKILFGDEEIGAPKGFLAYSEVGKRTGRVVYVNYGMPDDFSQIIDKKVDLNGTVLLLRAGQISFAEKVANAAKHGVAAVLIYPDPKDYNDFKGYTELYGHVHFGSGDPYTPGFPSFEHTQFAPTRSSGLPSVVAQTITADMALKILQKMGGERAPSNFQGGLKLPYNLGGADSMVTVIVNNELDETTFHNVFGLIEGSEESDRYVVIGAQRDSWGPGVAKSTVGTTLLVELARAVSEMVRNDHLSLRRSLVFVSWSGGEYGSVGATEWQEGYLSSLNMKAFTYIDLDGVIVGREDFKASGSPLLYGLLQKTLQKVKSPFSTRTLYDEYATRDFEGTIIEPMKMDDAAYTFLTLSGIPSLSFRFCEKKGDYKYFGTDMDNLDHIQYATGSKLPEVAVVAVQVAGQMALQLAYQPILPLDVERYGTEIRKKVIDVNLQIGHLKEVPNLDQDLAKVLSVQWLNMAVGSYGRASRNLKNTIQNSNLDDEEMRRMINDRIVKVEHNLLSPYVSVREAPFRHILFGVGNHTMDALLNHLHALKQNDPKSDASLFRTQFALATWTIQSCANDLVGPVWEMDNEL